MATYTWSIPSGKEITGSTYLKDTDNYIGDTINDLVDFVNGEGIHLDQGMTYDFVDKVNDQTITGKKTFTQEIIGNINTATKLQTPRKINNVDFDGTASITILDNTKLSISTGATNLTSTTTLVDEDEIIIADSTSSFSLKKLSLSNLKATLLTYFDTLYSRASAIFGIGQTWQDVTVSRNLDVTYTNNTGKPIMVTVVCQSSSLPDSYGRLYIYVSGLNVAAQTVTARGSSLDVSVTTFVPDGHTYLCTGTEVAKSKWLELR